MTINTKDRHHLSGLLYYIEFICNQAMKKTLFFLFIICTAITCNKKSTDGGPNPNPPVPNQSAKGADVSWLTEMEAAGKKFYNNAGTEQECMALLKSLGMNTIRLRVWVNPSPAWNNTAD